MDEKQRRRLFCLLDEQQLALTAHRDLQMWTYNCDALCSKVWDIGILSTSHLGAQRHDWGFSGHLGNLCVIEFWIKEDIIFANLKLILKAPGCYG